VASFNKIILMGNLTRDPQLKYLPSGTPVCEFGLATNRRWTDQASGQQREAVNFIDCQAMGKQAELLSRSFTKGKPILVEGRLDFRQWTTQAGEKRSKHEVFVEDFRFVASGGPGGGPGGDDDGGGGPPPPPRGGGRYGGPPQRGGQGEGMGGRGMDHGDGGGGPSPEDVPF
jgi:single-strand DNA-binding protein